MSIESILGITASIIAIGTLAFQGFQKYQRKDLSVSLTELADKRTTVSRQHQILRSIDRNLKASGFSISKSYIDEFVADGRSKSAIFHDICNKNVIEPTKDICERALGYDEPTFRKEWHNKHIASVQTGIQDWDTDFVYVSDRLKMVFPEFCKRLYDKFNEMGIPFAEIIGTKDIWCRDYMPIQISANRFIGYRYAPDYLKSQEIAYPRISQLAHLRHCDLVTDQEEVWRRNGMTYELITSNITLDGGNVVVAGDYVLLTNKIYSENNCSTAAEKTLLIDKIKKVFGLSPIIVSWGPKGDDVYGHTDGMFKAIPNNSHQESLLISSLFKNESVQLHKELDTLFTIRELAFDVKGKDFEKYAWAYINFLQVGNKILVPSFGLPCEPAVMAQIRDCYPQCIIDSIEMREIADQGGALHCITWNIKK